LKMETQQAKNWLKRAMRPYRVAIALLACLAVFSSFSTLAFAYITRFLIDDAASGNERGLMLYVGILLGLLCLRITLQALGRFFSDKTRAKIVRDLRNQVYENILRSDYAQIQGYHSGELLNRITTDLQEIATTQVWLLPSLAAMLTQCVGAILALLTTDVIFTVIYIACGVVFSGIAVLFRRQIKKRQKDVLEMDGRSRAYMQEGLSSLVTIKAYNAEEKSATENSLLTEKHYRAKLKRSALNSCMHAVFAFLSNFGLIFAIVWCGFSIFKGNTNYGVMLSVVLLLMQFQHPLSAFTTILPARYTQLTSGERISQLYELKKDDSATSCINVIPYTDISSIGVENVSFQYGEDKVFSNANMDIEKGDVVCITGASGSGKSTLFKLFLGIFQPNDGKIYLTTENGRVEVTAAHRELFAYVPQGNFLFSGAVYDNLTFFADESDKNDTCVREAIQIACAEFVYDLPQGLQTVLLEKGEGLSEGQLQRLAIARAIVSNRPILLFDEATSALDEQTESQIIDNIAKLENKTCVIVSHRPSALRIANKRFIVENGAIIKE